MILKRLIAVREATRYVKHGRISLRKLDASPLTVSRRIAAEIDDHVVHAARSAPEGLCLFIRWDLVVKSAHGAAFGVARCRYLPRLESRVPAPPSQRDPRFAGNSLGCPAEGPTSEPGPRELEDVLPSPNHLGHRRHGRPASRTWRNAPHQRSDLGRNVSRQGQNLERIRIREPKWRHDGSAAPQEELPLLLGAASGDDNDIWGRSSCRNCTKRP